VITPRALWPLLGWRGLAEELADLLVVRALAALPATRRTWRNAHVRLIQNMETLEQLPAARRERTIVVNHALFTEPLPRLPRESHGHCLFVGALESRKGASLAIRALACATDDVSLVVLGDGPERHRLQRLASRLGVAARVRFHGHVVRADIAKYLAASAAVVFTGLREEGGIALAETLLAGLPVIVLAHGGARTIVDSTTDASRVAWIEPGPVDVVARQIGAAMTRFTRVPPVETDPLLETTSAVRTLREVLLSTLEDRASLRVTA
jgi:glycosyltransferase involved in cell wall biosynthesis